MGGVSLEIALDAAGELQHLRPGRVGVAVPSDQRRRHLAPHPSRAVHEHPFSPFRGRDKSEGSERMHCVRVGGAKVFRQYYHGVCAKLWVRLRRRVIRSPRASRGSLCELLKCARVNCEMIPNVVSYLGVGGIKVSTVPIHTTKSGNSGLEAVLEGKGL